MVINHPVVHRGLHQEKMPNSNRIAIKTILSTSNEHKRRRFWHLEDGHTIIILENVLINEVICLLLIVTLHVLHDIDYN